MDKDLESGVNELDRVSESIKERIEKAKAADAVEARIADRHFEGLLAQYNESGNRNVLSDGDVVIALALTRNYRELMPNRQLVIEVLNKELDKAIAEEEAERNPPMETVPGETDLPDGMAAYPEDEAK